MAKSRDWTEILVRRGVIGPDQLKEASRAQAGPSKRRLVAWDTPMPTTS